MRKLRYRNSPFFDRLVKRQLIRINIAADPNQ
jgi:hypothetical protein